MTKTKRPIAGRPPTKPMSILAQSARIAESHQLMNNGAPLNLVTKPTADSTMIDIVSSVTWRGLLTRAAGGLTADQIHGIYTTRMDAEAVAAYLLAQRDAHAS